MANLVPKRYVWGKNGQALDVELQWIGSDGHHGSPMGHQIAGMFNVHPPNP